MLAVILFCSCCVIGVAVNAVLTYTQYEVVVQTYNDGIQQTQVTTLYYLPNGTQEYVRVNVTLEEIPMRQIKRKRQFNLQTRIFESHSLC